MEERRKDEARSSKEIPLWGEGAVEIGREMSTNAPLKLKNSASEGGRPLVFQNETRRLGAAIRGGSLPHQTARTLFVYQIYI